MDRQEFLKTLGYTGGVLIFSSCLVGCSKDSANPSNPPAPTVDFTLDLTLPANAALAKNGGFIYTNGVVVAKTATGNIIAVSEICTHPGFSTSVQYQSNTNQFWCPNHGAIFGVKGTAISGPTNGDLKQYTVTVTGNNVRING